MVVVILLVLVKVFEKGHPIISFGLFSYMIPFSFVFLFLLRKTSPSSSELILYISPPCHQQLTKPQFDCQATRVGPVSKGWSLVLHDTEVWRVVSHTWFVGSQCQRCWMKLSVEIIKKQEMEIKQVKIKRN